MKNWKHVSTTQVSSTLIGLFLFTVIFIKDDDKYIRILDDTNLMFHEAGHFIFGLFGQTLGLYGGTLGQLIFPIVVTISFWKRNELISFCIGAVWFFENLLNIARYMADARTQYLPLLGGGLHDWALIFGDLGLLHLDTTIASFVETLGFLGMAGSGFFLAWRWISQEKEESIQ